MTPIQLTAVLDGPYRGRSAEKPFCDGSHARTGWEEDA